MTSRRPAISTSTTLERVATAIDAFLDVQRTTSAWTRTFTGEGPATIQRSRRLASHCSKADHLPPVQGGPCVT